MFLNPARSHQLLERRVSELDTSLIPVLIPLPCPVAWLWQLPLWPPSRAAWLVPGLSGGGRLLFLSRAHRNSGAISDFCVLFCLRQKCILFFWLGLPGCLQGTWELSQERGKLLFSPRVKLSSQKIPGI